VQVLPVDAPGIGIRMVPQNLRCLTGRRRVNMQFAEIPGPKPLWASSSRGADDSERQHLMLRQTPVQLLDLAVAERLDSVIAFHTGAVRGVTGETLMVS